MSGRPALVRKREAVNVIKAAKQQGASRVEICWGNAKAVVHLREDDQKPVVEDANEWLESDDTHQA